MQADERCARKDDVAATYTELDRGDATVTQKLDHVSADYRRQPPRFLRPGVPLWGDRPVRTFATAYSGIGGIDLGLARTGLQPLWAVEADAYRRDVLKQRLHANVLDDVGTAAANPVVRDAAAPDLLYAELPDWRVPHWWPDLWSVIRASRTERLLLEFSPTTRFEPVVRDLVMADWAFRFYGLALAIQIESLPQDAWDHRNRAFLMASRTAQWVDGIKTASSASTAVYRFEKIDARLGTIEGYEATRALPSGWTCVCATPVCACEADRRYNAVRDATSPLMADVLCRIMSGDTLGDDRQRGTTMADGANANDRTTS